MSTFTKRKRNVFLRNKKDMKPFYDRDMRRKSPDGLQLLRSQFTIRDQKSLA